MSQVITPASGTVAFPGFTLTITRGAFRAHLFNGHVTVEPAGEVTSAGYADCPEHGRTCFATPRTGGACIAGMPGDPYLN